MSRLPAGWAALVAPLLRPDPPADDLAVAHDFVLSLGGLPREVHPALTPFFPHLDLPAAALIASFTGRADVRVPAWLCAERARHGIAAMLRTVGRAADAHTVEALEPIATHSSAIAAATWVTPDWVRSLRSLTHSAALGNFRKLCSLLAGGPDPRRVGPALGQAMVGLQLRLAQAAQRPFEREGDPLFLEMVRACLVDASDPR